MVFMLREYVIYNLYEQGVFSNCSDSTGKCVWFTATTSLVTGKSYLVHIYLLTQVNVYLHLLLQTMYHLVWRNWLPLLSSCNLCEGQILPEHIQPKTQTHIITNERRKDLFQCERVTHDTFRELKEFHFEVENQACQVIANENITLVKIIISNLFEMHRYDDNFSHITKQSE